MRASGSVEKDVRLGGAKAVHARMGDWRGQGGEKLGEEKRGGEQGDGSLDGAQPWSAVCAAGVDADVAAIVVVVAAAVVAGDVIAAAAVAAAPCAAAPQGRGTVPSAAWTPRRAATILGSPVRWSVPRRAARVPSDGTAGPVKVGENERERAGE